MTLALTVLVYGLITNWYLWRLRKISDETLADYKKLTAKVIEENSELRRQLEECQEMGRLKGIGEND